ncbi:MAG TPA: hypothetical protein ACFYEA_11450, partial [Candidatus Tripitaka californicus]|uniref:hypothetical protein n=1 Tax=Candidatus Tripitaka californicus TaxID=3367616 RepID=UPI004029256A
ETSEKVTATQCVILSEAKNLVFYEILRSLRSLRMTVSGVFQRSQFAVPKKSGLDKSSPYVTSLP